MSATKGGKVTTTTPAALEASKQTSTELLHMLVAFRDTLVVGGVDDVCKDEVGVCALTVLVLELLEGIGEGVEGGTVLVVLITLRVLLTKVVSRELMEDDMVDAV